MTVLGGGWRQSAAAAGERCRLAAGGVTLTVTRTMVGVEEVPAGVTSVCNDNYRPEPGPGPPVRARGAPRRAVRQVIKYSGRLKQSLVHEVQSLRPSARHST